MDFRPVAGYKYSMGKCSGYNPVSKSQVRQKVDIVLSTFDLLIVWNVCYDSCILLDLPCSVGDVNF